MAAALNCNIIPVLFFSRVKQSLDISRSWLAFLEILSSPSDHHLSLLADLWKKHNFHSFLVLKLHLFATQVPQLNLCCTQMSQINMQICYN